MYLLLVVLAQIGLLIAIINSYQKDLRRLKLELDYSNCYLEEAEKKVKEKSLKLMESENLSRALFEEGIKEIEKLFKMEDLYLSEKEKVKSLQQDIKDIMEIWIENYSWLEHEKYKAIDQLEEVINWKEDYILNLEDKIEEYEEQIAILKEQVKVIADLNDGKIKM